MVNLIDCQVISTRFIHHPTLVRLGLDKYVEKLFKGIGMSGFFQMCHDTYDYLTLEFISSFNVIKMNALITHVQFRLLNNDVRLTLKEFGKLFDLKSDKPIEPSQDHTAVVYKRLTKEDLVNLQHAKGTWIQHPVPKLWQRFAGLTIFGRHESANVRRDELELLASYIIPTAEKLNIPHRIANHFQRAANAADASRSRAPIYFGGLVTHIARKHLGWNPDGHRKVVGSNLMDLPYLGSLNWVQPQGSDTWWIVHRQSGRRDQVFTLPNPALTKFERGKPSYTFEINGQGEVQPPHPHHNPTIPPFTTHHTTNHLHPSPMACPLPRSITTSTPMPHMTFRLLGAN